jgi:hypothetical protein
MARKRSLASRSKASRSAVESAMEEVHTNIPSTVTRAKHFGPGGREAMLRAIAFSKARKGKSRG